MNYHDFELQLGPWHESKILARVLSSPAGQGEELVDLSRFLAETGRHDRQLDPADPPLTPREIGSGLYQALFSGSLERLLLQSLSHTQAAGLHEGLRLRLRISALDGNLSALHRLPWELLFRPETEDFLALDRRTPVLRSVDLPRAARTTPITAPLRVLAIAAQSAGLPGLDLGREVAELRRCLGRRKGIELVVLEEPDLPTLRRALTRVGFHVVHFMGHGAYSAEAGEGSLFLSSGEQPAVSGRALAIKIKDLDSLRLVVLNACESAVASDLAGQSPFGGVANALLLGGVPAVVAMRSPIADADAVVFAASFYEHLAMGASLEEAMAEGRQAIHSRSAQSASWAVPVLLLQSPSGELLRSPAAHLSPGAKLRRAAVASGLLLLLAIGLASLVPLRTWLRPEPQESAEKPASGPAGKAEPATEPLRVPPGAAPTAEAPARSRVESFTVGSGAQALRFEISGGGAGALKEAFVGSAELKRVQQAVAPAPPAGRLARLTAAEPKLTSTSEAGLALQSCRLSLSGSFVGATGPLPPMSAVGAGFDPEIACREAASKVASLLARQLAQTFKEEYP